jgi:FKBP-type peptidyl-prolyl cis-trans isomerase FkpA
MRSFWFFSLLMMFFACSEKEQQEEKPISWTKEQSVEFGRNLAMEEDIDIRLFLKRRENWEVQETGSGLRYWIYEKTGNPTAVEGDVVEVEFEVRLLDDSLAYKTERGEVASFLVDKSDVESGIQEGIKLMGKGDRGKFIIPSHLAHGLVGDLNKIPPLQVLVVDLHLVEIKKQR